MAAASTNRETMRHYQPFRELHRLRGDDGMTLIFVALLMVVILLGAALAIDGGQAYQQHRQMQNASDSATMAAIRLLDQNKYGTALGNAASEIRSEIYAKAQLNKSDSSGLECYLLNSSAAKITTLGAGSGEFCTNNVDQAAFNAAASSGGSAYGVSVKAAQTKNSNFARVIGINNITGRAPAAAMIRPFSGTTASPFMVCGFDPSNPNGGPTAPNDFAYNLLAYNSANNPQYTVRSDATDRYYYIQGSQVPDCGNTASSFDGHNDASTELPPIPNWIDPGTGNGYEDFIQIAVADMVACSPAGPDGIPGTNDDNTFDGCGLLIPIAVEWDGNTSGAKFWVVAWTVWQVWGSGNSYNFNSCQGAGTSNCGPSIGGGAGNVGKNCSNAIRVTANTGNMKYCGKLLGQSKMVVTGGTAGTGIPLAGQLRVFKFSE